MDALRHCWLDLAKLDLVVLYPPRALRRQLSKVVSAVVSEVLHTFVRLPPLERDEN
jgi:hypothetical protein